MSRWVPANQKNLLDKAKESALLSIDVYNKPQTSFRIWGFIVLMVVARTSLLHAIFEKNWKTYFYKEKKRFIKIDWEKKSWELKKCIQEYFWDANPIKSNIEFFIGLRNKIEHKFMPSIDDTIVWECQALIMNFENTLVKEFWQKNALIDKLFVPLQISHHKRKLTIKKDEQKVIEFIRTFRWSLDTNILNSSEYAYRMYLIPKIGNHENTSDVAIEFVKFDPNNPEDMKKYEHMIVGIKEKEVWVANQGKYRPSIILKKLKSLWYSDTNIKEHTCSWLNSWWHTKMRKKYKIRWKKGDANTQTKYCQLDEASTTKDFVYTEDWVNLLIEKELSPLNKI